MAGSAKEKFLGFFNDPKNPLTARYGFWPPDHPRLLRAVGRIMPCSLIDIGCGAGAFLLEVQKKYPGLRLGALDLSEGMIRETRSRLGGNVTARVGDAQDMPLAGGQYEAATCLMCLPCFSKPQAALEEIYRVLSPGGYLLLNDVERPSAILQWAEKTFPGAKSLPLRLYDRGEIVSMLKKAGFQKVLYRKISPVSFLCVAQK